MTKIRIILRSLLRQRLNSGVTVVSLSIGIACMNLIVLFISREWNTDSFQKDKVRIFALRCNDPWVPGSKMYQCKDGSAEYMKTNFTQVEDYCRLAATGAQKVIVNNETYFDHPGIIAASKNFFRFFSYELLTNNPGSSLEAENSLVISEDLSRKYFGKENALGKVIDLANGNKVEKMVVSGVFRKPRENSQLSFDMVRPFRKGDSRCYIKLANGANPSEVEKLFEQHKATIPSINDGTPGQYYLLPMRKVYFDTTRHVSYETARDIKDLWIALMIGLIIFSVALFNYLGLVNNSLANKSKIYAVQRVHGGTKLGFAVDYMMESLLLIGISFILSLILMMLMIPFFNELTNTVITADYFFKIRQIILSCFILAGLLVITSIFVVYRIRQNINFNTIKPGGFKTVKRIHLPAFNIFQLASSMVLIVFSFIIFKQTKYISDKPIGLDKQVIEVKIPGQFSNLVPVFKEELNSNSSISNVSIAGSSPVLEHFLVLLKYKVNGVDKEYVPAGFSGDENYISALGIEIIEGNGFSGNPVTDKKKCLINESLARLFPEQNIIGSSMPGLPEYIIIGIVRDFNYSSLKSVIEPAFISFNPNGLHLMVKPANNQTVQARIAISKTWEKLIPGYPIDEESIGDRYEWLHSENKNYIRLIGACSLLSLFLAMIGLFAISVQNSHNRIKEIGIRKVNGAKTLEVMALLNQDFIKWLAIAFVIATPVSYYFMNRWLGNFAYKTSLSWWIFFLAGFLALSVTLLTVSWQSWRAATRNPVEALRYE